MEGVLQPPKGHREQTLHALQTLLSCGLAPLRAGGGFTCSPASREASLPHLHFPLLLALQECISELPSSSHHASSSLSSTASHPPHPCMKPLPYPATSASYSPKNCRADVAGQKSLDTDFRLCILRHVLKSEIQGRMGYAGCIFLPLGFSRQGPRGGAGARQAPAHCSRTFYSDRDALCLCHPGR